jgi:uncharacterized membrane protein YjdF
MITLWLLVQFIFLMLEVFNPAMGSKLGWFNFVRKQFSFIAFLYVSYCFFRTKRSIEIFTNFWVILSTIEAAYCVKQQWLGFSGFEYTWLVSDPKRYDLFVNYGFVRKFGLLPDPAAAGVLSSYSFLPCVPKSGASNYCITFSYLFTSWHLLIPGLGRPHS